MKTLKNFEEYELDFLYKFEAEHPQFEITRSKFDSIINVSLKNSEYRYSFYIKRYKNFISLMHSINKYINKLTFKK